VATRQSAPIGSRPCQSVTRPPAPEAITLNDQTSTRIGSPAEEQIVLRKVPRRTDSVVHDGCKFEAADIDNHRIDQVLVTRVGKIVVGS
jgi:hypothetical protein